MLYVIIRLTIFLAVVHRVSLVSKKSRTFIGKIVETLAETIDRIELQSICETPLKPRIKSVIIRIHIR